MYIHSKQKPVEILKRQDFIRYVDEEKKLQNSAIIFSLILFLLGTSLIFKAKSEILIGIAYPLIVILGFMLIRTLNERKEISKLQKIRMTAIFSEKNTITRLIERKLKHLKQQIVLDYASFFLGFTCIFLGGFVLEYPRLLGIGTSWSFIGALSLILHLWSQWSTKEFLRKI